MSLRDISLRDFLLRDFLLRDFLLCAVVIGRTLTRGAGVPT